jgi:hypothetical protein
VTELGNPPHSHHATIEQAGECPDCRDYNIAMVRDLYGTSDLFSHYVLRFTDDDPNGEIVGHCGDPNCHDVQGHPIRAGRHLGIAIVPGPNMDEVIDNAWACGCNPGGSVAGQEIPHELVLRAGVLTCVLLTGDEAGAAMEAIRVATYEL